VKKLRLFEGEGIPSLRAGWEGTRTWPLWGERFAAVELEPDTIHGPHRHPGADQCTIVLEGGGQQLGLGEGVPFFAGQAAFAVANEWHGFHSSAATRMLTMFSGPTALELPSADASQDGPPRVLGRPSRRDPALGIEGGFDGLDVYWIVTTESCGSKALALGCSTFEASGRHELHRHPNAEEFLLITKGGGTHLSIGRETRLEAGEVALIDKGEWHGFDADPGVSTDCVFGYFGAGNLAYAGYEVRQ
jgi:quercetin dioxygenase-like cupin family protein